MQNCIIVLCACLCIWVYFTNILLNSQLNIFIILFTFSLNMLIRYGQHLHFPACKLQISIVNKASSILINIRNIIKYVLRYCIRRNWSIIQIAFNYFHSNMGWITIYMYSDCYSCMVRQRLLYLLTVSLQIFSWQISHSRKKFCTSAVDAQELNFERIISYFLYVFKYFFSL